MLDKVKDFFPKNSNINIIENTTDPNVQIEYFEYIFNKRKKKDEAEIIEQKDNLFKTDVSIADKKMLLTQLAVIPKVETFRAIEKYSKNPDAELKDWSYLALYESNAILRSDLLDEKEVYISTGLGGRGDKLRYFVVLITREQKILNELQKRIIKKEITFSSNKYEGEIEKIEFGEYFVTVLLLVSIDISIRKIFDAVIYESNELGDFLSEKFIVTNQKTFTPKETEKIINQIKNFKK